MTCICKHAYELHTPRMAREGKPRTVLVCLDITCKCEEFRQAEAEKCSIMTDDEMRERLRSLERDSRQFQLRIQEFKQALTTRAASREQQG